MRKSNFSHPSKRATIDGGKIALALVLLFSVLFSGLAYSPEPAQASPDNAPLLSSTAPTVNGLFHFPTTNGQMDAVNGTPDSTYYQQFATSYYGSGLYRYFDPANNRLYVALVVDHSVNDIVCGNETDYTASAGWNNPMRCQIKRDSEYAEFSLACAPNSPKSWTWRQRVGDPLNSANPHSNWVSNAICVDGNCATFGTNGADLGMQTATSWTANVNAYQSEYPYSTPWPPATGLPWNLYTSGINIGPPTFGWKSPFVSTAPLDVTQVSGYPVYSTYEQIGNSSNFSAAKGWEWSMVYEWSINLGPGGADCGSNPIWLITGLSHHSPMKTTTYNMQCGGNNDQGNQNDCFPPLGDDDPPQILTDWGDLPDIYGTTFANNGARHYIIANGAYLGQTVQAETDGQPTVDATGDGTEEDGIVFLTPFVPGGEALIQVTAGTAGYLSAFIDFNNNGTLSPVTLLSATGPAAVTTGTIGDTHLSAPGVYTLRISIPADATGPMYSRFRFTNNAGDGGNSPTGLAVSGEVEDYALASLGNRVWHDLNNNGIQDAGEPGMVNVLVRLLDGNGDPVLDADNNPVTTRTDLNGNYVFLGLAPGDYQVEFVAPGGYVITQQGQGGDPALDSDADPVTGRTAIYTLAPAQVKTDTDAGLVRAASIGNRVWLDENSDGYQDAGEPGIPNAQVNLYDSTGALVATTITDSNGNYLFSNLRPGTYYVDVLDGTGGQANSLPFAGLAQTPPSTLAGADFGNQAHTTAIPNTGFSGYAVTVAPGAENLTADFGYNYRPAADVNGNTGNGAIGDRIWSDADGDGVQDPGEPGLAGVSVTLYHDPDGDGVYDTVYATTTTDAAGNYLFNNLPPGAYVVRVDDSNFDPGGALDGYTQTGDPDDFGQLAANPDDQTTTPIILAPGDVFLNADFGYQPPAGQNNSVGDRVWFDADADGVQDAGEPGIPGVTVALLDANGKVIATTVTDANGNYLFTGVPDGNYSVWVNDTNNVLGDKAQTYDSDGLGTPNISAVALDPAGTNPDPVVNLDQDFGYTAPGQTTNTGLIGDRVWLDINGDGVQDANEPGLEGVRVELRDGSNNLIAVTFTDENGNYAFGGLPAGTYTVVVTPPAGMAQTYDADGTGSAHQSTATIAAGEINLLQDFGYRGTGTVGNLVWEDLNANGVVDGGETGIGGVTLDLYWDLNGNGVIDPGEPLVGTTLTASNGSYLFSGLPTDDGGGNAQFVVVVTDEAGVLNGYWHSLGAAGVDNNSQTDPYAVTLTPGMPNNTTADFGYYVQPAAVGDYVWLDRNNNGIQEADEPGIRGVKVTLTITYPNNAVVTVVTYTDRDGKYSFGNLLLDEDHRLADSNTDTPTYTITFETPPGATPSLVGQGDDPALDSNGASTAVTIAQGQTDLTYDSGFHTIRLDLGDLPDSLAGLPDYPTFFSPGPAHVIFPDTKTGTVSVANGSTTVTGTDTLFTTELYEGGYIVIDQVSYTIASIQSNTSLTLSSPYVGNATNSSFGNNQPNTTNGRIAVWLGTIVDVELDGFPSGTASGDDSNGANDEDGLVLSETGWTKTSTRQEGDPPSTATITLNSSAPTTVYFGMWIDWTGDGVFDAFYSGQDLTESPVDVVVDVVVPDEYEAGSDVYIRLRASEVSLAEEDYEGTIVNGEVEDYWYTFEEDGTTTPVTLSYFHAQRRGTNIATFDWSTSTETGNLGFNLYVADVNGQLQQINRELIASRVVDSVERQDYTFRAKVDGDTFYIEDVSIWGEIERHGPFEVGQVYGERVEAEPIDHAAIAREVNQKAAARQAELRKEMKLPAAALREPTFAAPQGPQLTNTVNILVNETGIQRVTYEALREAGLDLNRVPAVKVAVMNRGQVVPIHVEARGQFGPGSYLEFYGEALDTLYTDTNIYTVQVGSAGRMPTVNQPVNNRLQPAAYYLETLVVDEQKVYSATAPGDDPWYNARMLTYKSPRSWNFPFEISNLASDAVSGNLEVVLWGMTQLPINPDHHVIVSINGVQVADQTFDGLVMHVAKASIPAGLLRNGENILTLTLPGDTGAPHDLVHLDKFSVTYPRAFQAEEGRLAFSAAGDAFKVSNLPANDVTVYRLTENGPVRLSWVSVKREGGAFSATFAGTKQPATYLVTTSAAANRPALEPTRLAVNLDQPADFLIISHPHFIEGLAPLVAARRAEGLTVNVVDVEDLYAQYSHGIFDPKAIQAHIRHAAANLGAKYVLLVGGDTRDYRNFTGVGSISFIPSFYVRTGPIASFVPVDPLFADLTGDGLPDLPIGRFPVRTQAELSLMVQKTLAYGQKDYAGTALFVTDKRDGAVSFKSISRGMEVRLPAGWSVESVHLDDLTVAAARQQVLAAMNRGTALVTFTGHSSPSAWTFDSLFTTRHASALTNAGRPFVAVQWGCWNTYYVNPVAVYLQDSLLFSGDKGAAAVLGAVTLTDSRSEQLLGDLLTPRMTQPGARLGDALQESKAQLAQTRPDLLDVLLGWTLMGDPTLVIQP